MTPAQEGRPTTTNGVVAGIVPHTLLDRTQARHTAAAADRDALAGDGIMNGTAHVHRKAGTTCAHVRGR